MRRFSLSWRGISPTVSFLIVLLACHHNLASTTALSADPVRPNSFGDVLRAATASQIESTRMMSGDSSTDVPKDVVDWRYWCDYCACGFHKLKSYSDHLQGKRHLSNLHIADELWETYQQSPGWCKPLVFKKSVARQWSLNVFLSDLPARSRSSIRKTLGPSGGGGGGQLDPNIRLSDLPSDKQAALWRLLHHDTSCVPHLADMVAALPPHLVRVKELLESLQVFGHVQNLLCRNKGHRHTQQPRHHVKSIYDIGCGHGLVGMLCAAAYPDIQVYSIDIVPRESFEAHRTAFQKSGVALENLQFKPGDLSVLNDQPANANNKQQHPVDSNSNALLLCVHGCKSLTHESIDVAQANDWAWLVVPCCLQADNHLPDTLSLKLDDTTRFVMLCGAIAHLYQPDTVATIDSRITGRGIVLSKSLSPTLMPSDNGNE